MFLIITFLRVNISFYRIRTNPSQLCINPACQVSDSLLWWWWGILWFHQYSLNTNFLVLVYSCWLIKSNSHWSKIYDNMYCYIRTFVYEFTSISLKLNLTKSTNIVVHEYFWNHWPCRSTHSFFPCCFFPFVYFTCLCEFNLSVW